MFVFFSGKFIMYQYGNYFLFLAVLTVLTSALLLLTIDRIGKKADETALNIGK